MAVDMELLTEIVLFFFFFFFFLTPRKRCYGYSLEAARDYPQRVLHGEKENIYLETHLSRTLSKRCNFYHMMLRK